MSAVTYQIVEHDGGWAYRVGGTFSETFKTHAEALRAAQAAAVEQQVAGATEGIQYEDAEGTARCRKATIGRKRGSRTNREIG